MSKKRTEDGVAIGEVQNRPNYPDNKNLRTTEQTMTSRFPYRNHRGIVCVVALAGLHPGALPLHGQSKDFTIFTKYKALAPTLDKVDRLVADRQFDQARALIQSCLTKVPDHFEAHYYLAVMAYESKDYVTALACIERAMTSLAELDRLYQAGVAEVEASNLRNLSLLESTLEQADMGAGYNGCRDGEIQSLRAAISLEKRKSGPLSRSGDPFAAPREYPFLHGNCLFQIGRHAEAQLRYQAALQLDPTYGNAWNNLINLLWVDRDYDQAKACLRKAEAAKVQINPKLRLAVLSAGKPTVGGSAKANLD